MVVNIEELSKDHLAPIYFDWFCQKQGLDQDLDLLFRVYGNEDSLRNSSDTPDCQIHESSLGPISVSRTEPKFECLEQQFPDVKLGVYHAPAHCRAANRLAVVVPYRDRKRIFLFYSLTSSVPERVSPGLRDILLSNNVDQNSSTKLPYTTSRF